MDEQRLPSNAREPEPRVETAAEAFARLDNRVAGLDGRIALMARAVEHMAAERLNIEIPDYIPTLEKANGYLAAIHKRLSAIEDAPALDMTPEDMGARIAGAARRAREADEANLQQVQQSQTSTVEALRQIIGHARTRESQREHLLWGIGGGVLTGCLLWSLLPGMIARSVPESWHWPERLARRMVGGPNIWEAGSRMMQAGSPEAWRAISAAAAMRHENKDTIAKCEQKAEKRKATVRCTINVRESE
jgi:hypothetical protein